jgi:hypothetical protein
VWICFNSALMADIANEERELEAMPAGSAGSLAGDPRRPVAQKIEAMRAQMREDSEEFRFRALGRAAFRKLVASFPPREGNKGDKMLGYNEEALFVGVVRASLISPVLDDEDWLNLLGDDALLGVDPAADADIAAEDDEPREPVDPALSHAQFELLSDAAWSVNRRDTDIPFSLAASQILRISESE